ncbi:Tim44 domain-containing protein [Caldovatus aquaticus]|uniref:TIM44-like domain-containing protein n=1 Tax=Caldovatus aquaticus TaxID=2865671 RepID=A0ABS7F487_9PROT|nr:TIM44-like domain-containing protein [Caldovatus aquaticus]MBW8269605.1 TIM44-like domain-containing protein [Caldovatus aquaticus]
MRRLPTLLAAAAAVALALAPALADARVGGGRSSGSAGSRTYSAPPPTQTAPGPARPVERSMTEPSRANPGLAAPARPGMPAAGAPATGGFFSRSPFLAGLMGGLIGAGLGGLLFGGGLFGGMHGFAGFLGFLLQIALIAGLVWLGLRLFRALRGGQPAPAGGVPPHALGRTGHGPGLGAAGGGPAGAGMSAAAAPHGGEPIRLEKADFDTFERRLIEANEAWSRQDLAALQRIATPEMVQYFADDLAELASRGLRNETRDVRLEQGDLADAWRENGRDYARVAMRFSMVDVTRRLSDGAVVEGDPERRTEATEIWTFVRARGGEWLISAIQQTVPA